ncbi:hypothetical protein C6A85_35180, partial [Mycobacterium sp. ITM-2017-0098]
MRKAGGALGLLAAAAASLAGCGWQAADGIPAVDTADLQTDIAGRFADAGEHPESVTCKEPLVGEVGQTAHCDVVM